MTAELEPDSVWVIDDTGFAKQGKHSVGVERQYSGTLGKVGNARLRSSLHHVGRTRQTDSAEPVSAGKLDEDRKRREEAGKFRKKSFFKTKWQLSLNMIDQARAWAYRIA